MTEIYPMRIAPRFEERIWGGRALRDRLGKDTPAGKPIGESWEVYDENRVLNGSYAGMTLAELRRSMGAALLGDRLSAGEPFPLLTKILDAADALSVQVHPDNRLAQLLEGQPNGKTECWHVLSVEPNASLIYGFSRDVQPDEYRSLVRDGRLDEVLASIAVQPGDTVYVAAGMVHALGAGVVLYEVQQTSDVTYRIYDWNRRDAEGRARELHVEKAARVLDYHRNPRGLINPLADAATGRTVLVAGPYFRDELVDTEGRTQLATEGGPAVVFALESGATVAVGDGTPTPLPPYSSLVVPAAAGNFTIAAAGGQRARAIVSTLPASQSVIRDDLIRSGHSAQRVDEFLAQFAPLDGIGVEP
jgi:mannose-6-phosphate isomerase